MAEDKKKVSVWIPYDTIRQLEDKGYSQTEAILKGLECLITSDKQEDNDLTDGRYQELQAHIETLKNDVNRLEDDKKMLSDMYNKHVLQVQTLINSRMIEGETKKKWWKIW